MKRTRPLSVKTELRLELPDSLLDLGRTHLIICVQGQGAKKLISTLSFSLKTFWYRILN